MGKWGNEGWVKRGRKGEEMTERGEGGEVRERGQERGLGDWVARTIHYDVNNMRDNHT